MAKSIFTKIVDREEPGEVLYEDERVFILLSRAPHRPGHSLVVPRQEAETFYGMDAESYEYLMHVARQFALVLNEVFQPKVVALQIMGLGVPHVHVHLVPIDDEHDLDQDRAVFVDLDAIRPAAEKIRGYLAQHPFGPLQ